MSLFCSASQLKRIVGDEDFPPELERSRDYTILSIGMRDYLLHSCSFFRAYNIPWLSKAHISGYQSKELTDELLNWCERYLPHSLRLRLGSCTIGHKQLVREALDNGDIKLFEIRRPFKQHAPAKRSSLPLVDEIAPPPPQTGIPKPKTPTYWIEFCYQYEDNKKPISNVPFVLTMPDGSEIDGMLPDNGTVRIEDIKKPGEASIVYGEASADNEVDQLRQEIKQALATIVTEERAEAAEIEKKYQERNFIDRFYIRQFYLGKGIVNGAWGLLSWVGDVADAMSQFGVLDSMMQATMQQEYNYEDDKWKQHFLKNFTEEHKKKVVKAIGFDPESLTRENLAEAYEVYSLIKSDPESKAIIWGFIKDYASAQHELELAEAGGELGFEFILAAVLAAFSGGTGAAVLAPRLGSKMPKLGGLFQRLGKALKKLKLRKKNKGNTNKSTTTTVKRPEKTKLEAKKPNKPTPEEVKLAKSKGISPAHIAARRKVAKGFLDSNGFNPNISQEFMKTSFDWSQPMEVVSFPPPDTMKQWVASHGHHGNWFDPDGNGIPETLSINGKGRTPESFRTPNGIGLKSIAAPVKDANWGAGPDVLSQPGGASQLLVSDEVKSQFIKLGGG